jgi:hypothetical protein
VIRALLLGLLTATTGCASMAKPPAFAGASPAASWAMESRTIHQDAERTQWRYVLRLRDATGRGLHLTRVSRQFLGIDFQHWDRQFFDVDLRVPAGGEVTFPCGHSVFARVGLMGRNWHVTERRTYTGTDLQGASVQIDIDLPFGEVDGVPTPAPLLFFAGVTPFKAVVSTPACEGLASPRTVVDAAGDAAGGVHFLVTVDTVRRPVPVRTRWLDPAGQEVSVIDDVIKAEFVWGGYLFTHTTHSLPAERLGGRAGRWSVELSLDGKPAGVYHFDVTERSAR